METVLVLSLVGAGILAAGFLIGRYYIPDDRVRKRQTRRARAYARTVNHLLGDDRDLALGSAVEELTALVRSESVDDVEPYIALGALFRYRGEWERAIRVHQAIAVREGQGKDTRVRVSYELGLDFQHAGMPRKATRAMEAVLGDDAKHEGALGALARLYEEQGRYDEAADMLRRLARVRSEELPERHHHLLVAAAQRAVARGDADSARRLLREARSSGERSVHALVAAAELSVAQGNARGAAEELEEALTAAPELARVLVPGLVTTLRERAAAEAEKARTRKGDAGEPDDTLDERAARLAVEALERVSEAIGRNGHIEMAMAELRAHYDPAAALEDYRRIATQFPALLPARVAAARLALAEGDGDDVRRELGALVVAGGVLSWAMDGSWRCGRCGRREDSFFWACKGCRAWGTVRLDVGRDVLDAPPPPPRRIVVRDPVETALVGAASVRALPEPRLPGALDDELALAGSRSSVLDRVGGWFSDTWSGLRRSKRKELPGAAVKASLDSGTEPRADAPRLEPRGPEQGADALSFEPRDAEPRFDEPLPAPAVTESSVSGTGRSST